MLIPLKWKAIQSGVLVVQVRCLLVSCTLFAYLLIFSYPCEKRPGLNVVPYPYSFGKL